MASYDLILLGSMECGCMISCVLFGLVTMQAFFYYKKYSQDRFLLKGLVRCRVMLVLGFANTRASNAKGGCRVVGLNRRPSDMFELLMALLIQAS